MSLEATAALASCNIRPNDEGLWDYHGGLGKSWGNSGWTDCFTIGVAR